MVTDVWHALLGIDATAPLADVKAAYHRAAKRHHPDLFPAADRDRREQEMMKINEAYLRLVSAAVNGTESNQAGSPPAPESRPRSAERAARCEPPAGEAPRGPNNGTDVGDLRDPAYVYYKQGFRYYGLGATQLYRKDPAVMRRQLAELRTCNPHLLDLALRALTCFERAHGYFRTVVERYPHSIWAGDARYKLRRIQRFNAIYHRICANVSRGIADRASMTRRAS